jgi:hypothetical protein
VVLEFFKLFENLVSVVEKCINVKAFVNVILRELFIVIEFFFHAVNAFFETINL